MLTEPVGQLVAIEPACSEIEHEALVGIDGSIDLAAVEDQEGLHGGMPDPLVAVYEGVPLNQSQAQRRALSTRLGYKSTPPKVALG